MRSIMILSSKWKRRIFDIIRIILTFANKYNAKNNGLPFTIPNVWHTLTHPKRGSLSELPHQCNTTLTLNPQRIPCMYICAYNNYVFLACGNKFAFCQKRNGTTETVAWTTVCAIRVCLQPHFNERKLQKQLSTIYVQTYICTLRNLSLLDRSSNDGN